MPTANVPASCPPATSVPAGEVAQAEPGGPERKHRIEKTIKDVHDQKRKMRKKESSNSIDSQDSKKKGKKKPQPPYGEQMQTWTVPRIRFCSEK
jgi:hypothetical protein